MKTGRKGKRTGKKKPLNREYVNRVLNYLVHQRRSRNRIRNLVLFTLALDTALRTVDILKLRAGDVADQYGEPYETFTVTQKKLIKEGRRLADTVVTCSLSGITKALVKQLILEARKTKDDFLFTRHGHNQVPISDRWFRKLFTQWMEAVQIDPEHYGCHSLRRTYGQYLLEKDVPLRVVQTLLGHGSEKTTAAYFDLPVLKLLEAKKVYPLLPEVLELEIN